MFRKVLGMLLAVLCLTMSAMPVLAEETETTEAPTPEVVATVAPTATPIVYRELLNGSQDEEGQEFVLRLQQRLIEIGYLDGEADGYYGDRTEKSVSVFQELNGLPVTGVADMETQVMLYTAEKLAPAPTPEPTPRVNGVSGDDIKEAQEKLIQWGFLNGRADGDFGRATEQGVKFYKNYIYELTQPAPTPTPEPTEEPTPEPTEAPVDSTENESTSDETGDESAEPTAEPEPTPEPFVATGEIDDEMLETLRRGDFEVYREDMQNDSTGREVERLQTRLGQLGYLYIAEGGVDGYFGQLTEGALRYFQRRNGLDQTGVATESVQRLLFSADAKQSDERVFPYKLYVDVSDQRVYVYKWNGESYEENVKTFVCSTGTKATPTILGTYSCDGKAGEWYYFQKYNCWARYAFRIQGGYLFHSVTFSSQNSRPSSGAVANLGRRASHGCVRLSVEDAKWIYENCPNGITVVIRE